MFRFVRAKVDSGSESYRTEEHRALLQSLTATHGAITSKSSYASHRNFEWFDQENGDIRLGRENVHREIVHGFRMESPTPRCERQAILLAGPPGAGKTTAQEDLFESTGTTASDWRVLNADDFKDRLLKRAISDGTYFSSLTPPEVSKAEERHGKVWPRERSALVHEESSMLMKDARDQAMRLGENVIIDGTLSNAEDGKKFVKRLAQEGYNVRITLVDGPRDVTEARVAHRWNRGYDRAVKGIYEPEDPDLLTLGGRWVPSEVVDHLYPDGDKESMCTRSATEIAQSSEAVTQFDVYRITDPAGKPVLIEQRKGKSQGGRWASIYRSKRAEKIEPPAPAPASGASAPRCSGCGRPLRSAESIARGAGPKCAAGKS